MTLICVIMGAETRDVRNAQATRLLDWGFANYELYRAKGGHVADVAVTGGVQSSCAMSCEGFSIVLPKGASARIKVEKVLPNTCAAPVQKGEEVGHLLYTLDGKALGKVPICADERVDRIGFWEIWRRLVAKILLA